ncbi:phosphotransferase [Nonomuraea sp. NPDC050328]|uniref:phosphotransferase n=1 Tax=Nonomuraea sp. NPDC050328 TaxID=3364361 RepID=UPI0037B43710
MIPGIVEHSRVRLGEGVDNVAWEINGEYVVRVGKGAVNPAEVAILRAVAEVSPLPVPVPVHADPEAGVLAYRKLPGVPLIDGPAVDPVRLAPALGGFLTAIHGALIGAERDDYPLSGLLEEAEESFAEVAPELPARARARVEEFLGTAPPPAGEAVVFCHNDLGAEHLLVEHGSISGVIDWGDAALTDPARDFALLWRDLGPATYARILESYGGPAPEHARVLFYARCSLLEDLVHGLSTDRRYFEAGLAHLDWTFG